MNRTLALTVVVASLLGWGALANACNIPVFRYALENWRPDPFSVFVLHRGDLSAEQQSLVEQLQASAMENQSKANAVFFVLDVRQLESDQWETRQEWPVGTIEYLRRWLASAPLESPTIVTLFPHQLPQSLPAWQGEFSAANVKQLIDSPVRQEIARRILAGQSAVWVLIESGNQAADEAAFQRLDSLLKDAPNRVSLPDQELIESDDEFNPANKIELKVEFSALRVSRNSASEAALVSMLLGSEEDLRDFNEPIAVPVFGRGRTYFALVGKGINPDTVNDNCQFLCGACSCQVKQENPGIDLLVAMDWQEHVTESAINSAPLPELTGIGAFEIDRQVVNEAASDASIENATAAVVDQTIDGSESTTTKAVPAAAIAAPLTTGEQAEATAAAPSEESGGSFERQLLVWLVALLALGLIFAVGSTMIVKRNTATR